MPTLTKKLPKYRLHRASGQAIVTIGGEDFYLGRHGTKESRDRYDRRIAEWLACGRQVLQTSRKDRCLLTISQLFIAYWSHVETYYRKDGNPTGEVQSIKYSLRPLVNLFGETAVEDFGPLQLKAVREQMIASGWVRRLINHRIGRIRRMFRWGVENALVTPSVLHGLQAVSPLKFGRVTSPESKPVRPVPEEVLKATQRLLPPVVVAMTELQRLTGMRPNEVIAMRLSEIDRADDVWMYRPTSHKTQHHGRDRQIPLGPRCQLILQPFINVKRPEMYLFSPRQRMRELQLVRRLNNKTPITPSREKRKRKQNPKRAAGERYTTLSYARVIARACKKADVERWGPNRLRHNAATEFRKKYGLDVARAILGHSTPVVTEVYAELDTTKAIDVAKVAM